MILNFTDPFFTTRVLGFEPLFDRLQRLSESSDRSSSYPPYNIRKDGNHFAYINIDSAIITRRSSMVNERISSLVIKFLSNFDIGRFNFEQRKVMAKDLRGGRCEDGEHEEPQWIQLGCHKRIEPRGAGIGIALSKGKFNITCSDGGFILRVGNF